MSSSYLDHPYRDAEGRLVPSCQNCRHLDRESGKICAAYPDGIPMTIFNGMTPHTEPLPADNGIQYEPVEEWLTEQVDGSWQ